MEEFMMSGLAHILILLLVFAAPALAAYAAMIDGESQPRQARVSQHFASLLLVLVCVALITWVVPPGGAALSVLPPTPSPTRFSGPTELTEAPQPWPSLTPTSSPTLTATPKVAPGAHEADKGTATPSSPCGPPPDQMVPGCVEGQNFNGIDDPCYDPPRMEGAIVVNGSAYHGEFWKYLVGYYDPHFCRYNPLPDGEDEVENDVLLRWDSWRQALARYGPGWYTLELTVWRRDSQWAYPAPCRVRVCLHN
jgi:hypothetical protein